MYYAVSLGSRDSKIYHIVSLSCFHQFLIPKVPSYFINLCPFPYHFIIFSKLFHQFMSISISFYHFFYFKVSFIVVHTLVIKFLNQAMNIGRSYTSA